MTFLKVAPSPGGELKNGGTSNEPAPSSSQPSPSSPPHQRRSAELTASFTLEANSFVSEAGTSIASMERRESIGRPEMHRVFLWFATEEREHDYSQQMSDARIERIGAEAPAYAALSLVVCATCAADAWLAAGGVPTSALVVVVDAARGGEERWDEVRTIVRGALDGTLPVPPTAPLMVFASKLDDLEDERAQVCADSALS